MVLTNDERGWVMTVLSGIACVFGASIICVDIIIRKFPGKRNFRIQDSDTFLSASLSLSFGVMLFSALYSMLPSSRRSLQDGGFSPKESAWIMIACFLGGVIGIQIISRYLHALMPSHVVDCEHTHDSETSEATSHDHSHHNDREHSHDHSSHGTKTDPNALVSEHGNHHEIVIKTSPEMAQSDERSHVVPQEQLVVPLPQDLSRRPSLKQLFTSSISPLIPKNDHDEVGSACFGFSTPCTEECFKVVNARGGLKFGGSIRPGAQSKASSTPLGQATESTPLLSKKPVVETESTQHLHEPHSNHQCSSASSDTLEAGPEPSLHKTHTNHSHASHSPDHHHHVPANAFLSIGLQTSIAIALHKLPEGFITFATNHANPKLGVAVFLALFIHNITEGFALALPLYLALNNRAKAMAIAFVLGGLSQPLGAGVAALWFKIAGQGDWAPSEGVYGGMFAVTAGIMASVALSLFSESLDLTHNRTLCMIGAFTGMGILGVSSALTA